MKVRSVKSDYETKTTKQYHKMEETKVPRQRFTLHILTTIKDAQNTNGLRMAANYRRYRQYCSRRLRRLRKCSQIRFMYAGKSGRGFLKKEITPDVVDDLRYLQVLLMNSERAWSYSRELKAENEAYDLPRKYFHKKKRLAKASQWAEKLHALCVECADDRTALEAQAYASWMKATYLLECSTWETSLTHFAVARKIYDQLSRVGTMEQQEMFKERVSEIDPSIGYCKFNIGLTSGDGGANAMSEKEQQDALQDMSYDLQTKINVVLSQTRREQADTKDSIKWLGTVLPLRSENMRKAVIKIQDYLFNFESILSSTTNQPQREDAFLKVQGSYDDAASTLRSDIKKAKGRGEQKSELLLRELGLMGNWLRYKKLRNIMTRAEERATIMNEHRKKNGEGSNKQNASSTSGNDSSTDMVKLYDTLMQYAQEALDLEGVKESLEDYRELQAVHCEYRATRCYYMAESQEVSNKLSDAFVLYRHTITIAEESIRHQKTRDPSDANSTKQIAAGIESMNGMVSKVQNMLTVLSAKYALDNAKHNNVGVVTNTKRPLISRLHDYDSGVSDDLNLISLPPAPVLIECKPIFFNTSGGMLNMPDLEDRIEETKTEDAGGGFFSYFGGN